MVSTWKNADEQEITDEMIINIVNKENESRDVKPVPMKIKRKSLMQMELKAMENTIEYIE